MATTISSAEWMGGTAEEMAELRQFARDVDWGPDPIVDPDFAADHQLAELGDVPASLAAALRPLLVASAERRVQSRASGSREIDPCQLAR